MTKLTWLDPSAPDAAFPAVETALKDPEGLLAAGGDLSPVRLLNAYRHGVFPWYEEGQPILWWSPDPRAIFYTGQIKVSRSLRKTLRHKAFSVTVNQDFPMVVEHCAAPRKNSSGTWITREMKSAYTELHYQGHAHSIEVWDEEQKLVGGLYGLLLDRVFSGESMFSRRPDMSKIALLALSEWLQEKHIPVIDCQLPNPHLSSLGAIAMPRHEFISTYLQGHS
ncbi:MAG TPA: leucyl/phenylalanyl-tRNA--protein transferase [Gammaproteobacteria bacterium]|nr:leucyl/phenylalanyl-tRNA--protein transferase [Gammaproteobacteria bacterium]